MGGQILVEMLSVSPDICQYAMIESALVIPMGRTNLMIGPMVGMSYRLIQKQWFAKLQFQQLHIHSDLFEMYDRDTWQIKKENMKAFLKSNSSYCLKDSIQKSTAKVIIAVGEKEMPKIQKNM